MALGTGKRIFTIERNLRIMAIMAEAGMRKPARGHPRLDNLPVHPGIWPQLTLGLMTKLTSILQVALAGRSVLGAWAPARNAIRSVLSGPEGGGRYYPLIGGRLRLYAARLHL